MSAVERAPDLLDGEFYAGDPDPSYAWLRSNAPVYRDPRNEMWGISRYRDVVAVEKDPELFCSSRGYRPKSQSDPSMIGHDDPRHLEQRRVLFRRFTPRQVAKTEGHARATVTRLLDRVVEQGHCDVVAELAIPLPVITILEWIGFDPDEWPAFAEWSETTNAAGGGPAYFHDGVLKAVEAFLGEAHALIRARRATPRDDAASAIVAASDAGDVKRSDDEIAMELLLLLNGGSDTTRHVIAGATLALLEHPDEHRKLLADPALLPTAVEEFVRWVTPILNMRRTATRDTELAGTPIREGDELLLMYSSANRDETIFADPQRFDVTRHPNPHIAFGFGTHFCLGASLARLEIRVMFEELLRRLPGLRLAPGAGAPRRVPNAFTRGLAALPVEFEPSGVSAR